MARYTKRQTLVLLVTLVVLGIWIALVTVLPVNRTTMTVAIGITAVFLIARLVERLSHRRSQSGSGNAP
jgi:hypothetical protein